MYLDLAQRFSQGVAPTWRTTNRSNQHRVGLGIQLGPARVHPQWKGNNMFDFIFWYAIVVTLLWLATVLYYERQLNRKSTKSEPLNVLESRPDLAAWGLIPGHEGPQPYSYDRYELEPYVTIVNVDKDRSLHGKSRRIQRKAQRKLDRIDKAFSETPVDVIDSW